MRINQKRQLESIRSSGQKLTAKTRLLTRLSGVLQKIKPIFEEMMKRWAIYNRKVAIDTSCVNLDFDNMVLKTAGRNEKLGPLNFNFWQN